MAVAEAAPAVSQAAYGLELTDEDRDYNYFDAPVVATQNVLIQNQ